MSTPPADPTPDTALVELVAKALWRQCGAPTTRPTPQCHEDARAVLAALATEGRLMPPGGETCEEWGTRIKAHGEYGEEFSASFDGGGMTQKERAYLRAEHWKRRFGDDLVDVMRREIAVGPWTPVPTDTEERP